VRSGNPLADAGFEHFYSLEYDQALESFQAEAAQNPSSPDALNHIAQTIMFRQIYRAGELESDLVTSANSFLFRPKIKLSTVDQERFSSALERAMALEDGLLKKNPQDSGALYTKGVSYGIRANYNFLFKKAFFDALRDTTTARKLESQVVEMDPSFIDARLILGVHDYVVGSLGLGWKMLGSVSGFHGDREQGIRTLKLVTEKGRLNRFDAQALLIAIYRREKMPEAAIPLLNDSVQRFPRSSLPRFELAEMYGDLGDRDRALAAIDEIERLKRADAPGYHTLPEAKIRFTRANALFSFNDLDRAFAPWITQASWILRQQPLRGCESGRFTI